MKVGFSVPTTRLTSLWILLDLTKFWRIIYLFIYLFKKIVV